MQYESVIGLEVHAQLRTRSKIFCGCSTSFGAEPNSHTCPVCLGMPGVLPVLNKQVVEFALRLALATNCEVAPKSVFARKNYFYPDLPKGYQISQYELPLAVGGYLEVPLEQGGPKRIGITRIHMEEDAGKLIHDERRAVSYVDFNRTGVPLLEIVSEPDIRSAQEAVAYLKELREILVYLEICDGNMEEGSFRCDANVSVRPLGQREFGTRTELKNMNSFRNVQKAISYEIERQIGILREGGRIVQETRLWDEQRQITYSMRGKEEAHDYRYFPDPDLVPLCIDSHWLQRVRSELPELPAAKRARFISQYGLRPYDAELLTSSRALADYFEACVALYPDARQVSNWISGELLAILNREGVAIQDCPIRPEHLAEMLSLLEQGRISRRIAQNLFQEMYHSGAPPEKIVREKGWATLSDVESLRELVDRILQENPKEVEAFRAGKTKLLGFFMGQIMRLSQGRADPELVQRILEEKLSSGSNGG
ncbi:MAG: Asp-tRNA(Asn)/Glu-tRNA(Gln) amidotransferase subunit GatB [Thermodesulfobacteriota bacterium]